MSPAALPVEGRAQQDPLFSRAFPSYRGSISNPHIPKPVHLPALQTNKQRSCTKGEFKGGTTPGIKHLLGTNAFCILLSCQLLQGKTCRIVPAPCMLQQLHSLLCAPRFAFCHVWSMQVQLHLEQLAVGFPPVS